MLKTKNILIWIKLNQVHWQNCFSKVKGNQQRAVRKVHVGKLMNQNVDCILKRVVKVMEEKLTFFCFSSLPAIRRADLLKITNDLFRRKLMTSHLNCFELMGMKSRTCVRHKVFHSVWIWLHIHKSRLISDRSVRSLSAFILLTVVCVNYLTMYAQSIKNWKNGITFTCKFYIIIVFKNCILFLSDLTDLPIVKNSIVKLPVLISYIPLFRTDIDEKGQLILKRFYWIRPQNNRAFHDEINFYISRQILNRHPLMIPEMIQLQKGK